MLAGSKRRMHERLTGLPGRTTNVAGQFSAGDKVVPSLVCRGTHTGSYGAFGRTGEPGEGQDFAT